LQDQRDVSSGFPPVFRIGQGGFKIKGLYVGLALEQVLVDGVANADGRLLKRLLKRLLEHVFNSSVEAVNRERRQNAEY
tara:strand:+ start:1331 stop:1567 length:237 start_codon:yes stop_codon:yes gene_type:complete